MLISINYKPISAPWGGANQIVSALYKYLKKKHKIVFDLNSSKIDIILIIDPRNVPNVCYSIKEINEYLSNKNSSAIVVHRINECDERKGTKLVNFQMRLANFFADHTLVISRFLKKLNLFYNKKRNNISVILNGQDKEVFTYKNKRKKNFCNSKIKLVTHHWSSNFNKGHDIYKYIDNLISTSRWKKKIEFSYIGNYPNNLKYQNTKFIKPLSGIKLARELQKHDIHVNATINEPGGNSSGEAALCGLPLLYRNSGAVPETASGFGEKFSSIDNFEDKLQKIINSYNDYHNKLYFYPHTTQNMCKEYEKLFYILIRNKKKYIEKRHSNLLMNFILRSGLIKLLLSKYLSF